MTLATALASALRGASCDARATSSRKLLRREPAGASTPVHREHLSSGVSEALVRRVARSGRRRRGDVCERRHVRLRGELVRTRGRDRDHELFSRGDG